MDRLPEGVYELLLSRRIKELLEKNGSTSESYLGTIEPEELARHIGMSLSREIALLVTERLQESREPSTDPSRLFDEGAFELIRDNLPQESSLLLGIGRGKDLPRPDTPLSQSALLTGSSRSPSLYSQLSKELESCDRAHWLISFIKYSGLLQLLPALQRFTSRALPDGQPRLRIATTSYMGATDYKALEVLQELPNTEIRISLDTRRTRLHAKAYLFYRESGFSSAYIGSANISKAALGEGLEWTAKLSQYESEHLWQHAVATFDSHWEDEGEFSPIENYSREDIREALRREGPGQQEGSAIPLFDLRPYEFQRIILEDIAAQRAAGRNRHLVIAATGTGKTMVAAFDYREYCRRTKTRPSLLFVAHRQEILNQALFSFRQVLGMGSFGEILAGGNQPESYEQLFCTVQSWNARALYGLPADYYEYVVLDEAHHGAASSYQRLIDHIEPKSLLGLTATPERSDGKDIRGDFGGSYTHELRLAEAVERALLSPFHYYGIPDQPGLDLSNLKWVRGTYDPQQLSSLLEENDGRARWVLSQLEKHVARIDQIRALGFCVSVAHARFMAASSQALGLAACALTGESSKEERDSVQRRLERREVNIIYTVDLYNEGVDLPFVDTVLFLRPTESLTLFLQQLGRGLRLHPQKSHLTVLDFIAPANSHFDFLSRYRALSARPERHMTQQIREQMPFVPAGCFVHLERQAKEHVLDAIGRATRSLKKRSFFFRLSRLLESSGPDIGLTELIDHFCLSSPDEIYRKGLPSNLLAAAAGRIEEEAIDRRDHRLNQGFRRLLTLDDSLLLEQYRDLLSDGAPLPEELSVLIHAVLWSKKELPYTEVDRLDSYLTGTSHVRKDLLELLDWQLSHLSPSRQERFEATGGLHLHACYTREQISLACGKGTLGKPYPSREGVLHLPEKRADLFFVDINKDESDFSPTTMYEDYAITDRLFHWQSQSTTSEQSPTGRRYIEHQDLGYVPYLFVREHKKLDNGLTSPYLFAGPLRYRRHEGSRPMSIIWELEEPLPAKSLHWARRVG